MESPRKINETAAVTAYFIFWGVFFIAFWLRVIRFDAAGNAFACHNSLWGDWTKHFTFTSAMAYRSLWLTDNPLLIGTSPNYYLFANMLSAVLIRSGTPFFAAFVIPSCLFSLLIVYALFFFYREIFQSKVMAVVSSCLFLIGGGFHTLKDPKILWHIPIDTMIIPQRPFTHGFPLALWALGFLYRFVDRRVPPTLNRLWIYGTGLLLGILPIVHAHSFLASGLIAGSWFIADTFFSQEKPQRERLVIWLVLFVVAAVPAVPLFLYISHTGARDVFAWLPGWYAREYHINWIALWLKEWGMVFIGAAIGFILLLREKQSPGEKGWTAFIYLPFIFLFMSMNLIQVHPWAWDNTKFLVWALVGFAGLAAVFLRRLWALSKPLTGVLLISMTFFGASDLWRIERKLSRPYPLYSREEFELAEWVRANTPVHSVWLIAPVSNHWLSNLTGRQAVITYPGWLWAQGYDYRAILEDAKKMFEDPEHTKTLYEKYGIDYVVIGDFEKLGGADPEKFRKVFSIFKTSPHTILFSRRPLSPPGDAVENRKDDRRPLGGI